MPEEVECPVCQADVTIPADSDLDDIVECSECDAYLEIVGIDPFEVDEVDELPDEEDGDF